MNEAFVPKRLFARARYLSELITDLTGADPGEETRTRKVVLSRTLVARTLLKEGWTQHQTGMVLGIDHSTVAHYTKKDYSLPGWEAEREIEKQFEICLQTNK